MQVEPVPGTRPMGGLSRRYRYRILSGSCFISAVPAELSLSSLSRPHVVGYAPCVLWRGHAPNSRHGIPSSELYTSLSNMGPLYR